MFQLPYEFSILDILFEEELEQQHIHLLGFGLKIGELYSETMKYVESIIPLNIKASRNDCFALALAKQENCPLLTGDKSLKIAAENEDVEVKGTIWLVVELIKQEILNIDQARNAFLLMKNSGRRLPWNIAESELQKLEHL